MRRLFGALLASAVVAIAVAGSTGATNGNLPGGTSISVSITAPANGASLPLGPVAVTGTASVGQGAPQANTTLIYIVDVSGSTQTATGVPGKCPRQNVWDLTADTTLDCELLAVRDLNGAAIATGTVAQVGMIGFANTGGDTLSPLNITSAAALDLSPLGGVSTLTAPGANDFVPPVGMTPGPFTATTNLDWVIQSAYLAVASPTVVGWPPRGPSDGFTLFSVPAHDFGSGTNYTAALYALKTLLASVPTGQNVTVAFLSDGVPNATVQAQPLATVLATLPTSKLTIDTFAVGVGTCGTNPPASIDGSLEQISQHFGKHCQVLHNASDAIDLVPGVVASKLSSISLSTDGGPAVPVLSTSPPLPLTGPASLTWTQTISPGPGTHQICVTANGSDGGGTGSVNDCVTVTLVAPPVVTPADASGDEGADIPISGTVTSSAVTTPTYHWTVSPGPDGASCTIADPSALSTTVNCNDDGPFTLTLTADDGGNPPVSATSTLTVANVPPSVTISQPAPGTYGQDAALNLDASFTDPGSNDTQTCTIDWGDGSTDPGVVSGTDCQGQHTWTTPGPHDITVKVTDDNGGTGQAQVTIISDPPPVVTVPANSSGDEGSPIALNGTITDNGPTFQQWIYSPLSGVDPGATCSFGDQYSPVTTFTCTDDGTYKVTLQVGDNYNGGVFASGTVTVHNVAPSVSIASPAPGIYAQGAAISLDAPVSDPGSNDTQSCTIDWGDGSSDTSVVAGGGCQGTHTYTTGGAHTINVTATDDNGGSGSASTAIQSDPPPSVSVSDASGNEGAVIPVSTSITDNGPVSLSWSYAAVSGVDPGATCSFAGPTVKCTDDGVYSITLTVDDHVNPPVSASGTLTVSNVAPTVSIATPAAGSYAGTAAITLNAPFTDPGSNDTQTCTVDWGDGTTDTGAPVGASCQGTHTYSGGASHTIKVTVTDDDGGAGSATVTVTSNLPPVVTVPAASSGNEGAAIPVVGTVTDDGPDTLTWTYAAVSGVDPGATCTFANPAAMSTTVKCTDDGVYSITLTANDGVNPAVSATGTLTVANKAPSVSITKPTANALVQSSTSVALHAPFTDPGANDTQTCSVDWGDGSLTTGSVTGNACDASHSYTAGGTQTITVTVTDDDGGSGTATVKIRVNRPPDCTHATASPSVLWPPDHQFVLITVSGVTDADGNPIDQDITGVTQDEALNGHGDGDTDHDAQWAWKDWQVWVRAERSDYGNGRVYRISFKASDGKGGSCTGVVKVGVPHDRHGTAVDNPSVSVDSFGRYDDRDKHHRH